jgi:zinc-binding alcohol dehydrogenase family protein
MRWNVRARLCRKSTLALSSWAPGERETEKTYRVPGCSLRPRIGLPSSDHVTELMSLPSTCGDNVRMHTNGIPVSCALPSFSIGVPIDRATCEPFTAVQTLRDVHDTALSSPGLQKGELKPVVAEAFPFDRAPDAHRFIAERRNIGKVVLVP